MKKNYLFPNMKIMALECEERVSNSITNPDDMDITGNPDEGEL